MNSRQLEKEMFAEFFDAVGVVLFIAVAVIVGFVFLPGVN